MNNYRRMMLSVLMCVFLLCGLYSFSYAGKYDAILDEIQSALDETESTQSNDKISQAKFPPLEKEIPVAKTDIPVTRSDKITATATNGYIIDILDLKNMDMMDVLKLIAKKSGLNIVAGKNVKGNVTIYLQNVDVRDALKIILDSYDLASIEEEGIIRVMTGADFEKKFGHPFGEERTTQIINLLYANVPDVVLLLNQMKNTTGKVITDGKSRTIVVMDTPSKLEEMKNLVAQFDVPIETEVFELSYATTKDIEGKLTEILTPNIGQLKSDERSNKIIITDTKEKIKKIEKVIEAFDQQEREVLIEAKIVQIVLSDEHKMGVDWEGIVQNYHQLDLKSNFDVLGATEKRGSVSIGTLSSDDYTVLIDALETVGMTNILSSPKITAINNHEAKILVGSTEPYVTSTTTTPSSGPTTTAESVNFIEVGVKLYVTPTIHTDDFVTLKIKPEVSSVTSNITTSNNNTIPIVETSEAETTVRVKDGVTIIIGGLIKEEKIDSIKKVPLLGDIPLLGMMFKNSNKLVKKTELVIFLTPKIITGDVESDRTDYGFEF